MSEILPLLQAGGTAAVPVVLYFGIRYLADQLDSARVETRTAHETTVGILTSCIKDNTVALQEVKGVIQNCHLAAERNRVAVALAYPRPDPNKPSPEDRP